MLFRLVRPMKRSGSAQAQFVQRIPRDVKALAVGLQLRIPLGSGIVEKTISLKAQDIRFSLQTTEPSEVKTRQAVAAAHLERVWQSIRESSDHGPIRLRQDQVVALAGELYATFMRAFEAEPGPPERWRRVREEIEEATRYRIPREDGVASGEVVDAERTAAMEHAFGRGADELLATKVLIVDADSRSRLSEAIARVKRDVAVVLERRSEGDYSADLGASKFPRWQAPAAATSLPEKARKIQAPTSTSRDFPREAAGGRSTARDRAFRPVVAVAGSGEAPERPRHRLKLRAPGLEIAHRMHREAPHALA